MEIPVAPIAEWVLILVCEKVSRQTRRKLARLRFMGLSVPAWKPAWKNVYIQYLADAETANLIEKMIREDMEDDRKINRMLILSLPSKVWHDCHDVFNSI